MPELLAVIGALALIPAVIVSLGGGFILVIKLFDKFL